MHIYAHFSTKLRILSTGSPKKESKSVKRVTVAVSPKVKPFASSSATTQQKDDTKSKVPIGNAWSKPLQTSINTLEKVTPLVLVAECAKSDNAKTSYAWSKVVGSKVGASSDKASTTNSDLGKSEVTPVTPSPKSTTSLNEQVCI